MLQRLLHCCWPIQPATSVLWPLMPLHRCPRRRQHRQQRRPAQAALRLVLEARQQQLRRYAAAEGVQGPAQVQLLARRFLMSPALAAPQGRLAALLAALWPAGAAVLWKQTLHWQLQAPH